MASTAQVFPHHTYGAAEPRPLRFQTYDPVVLPRSRSWDISGGLIGAAAIATLLVTGAAYAISYTETPSLGVTEAPALEREYTPDDSFARASTLKALSGPMVVSPAAAWVETSAPHLESAWESAAPSTADASEVRIDDSAPGVQESLPQPAEDQAATAPYPNPTTTPPDVIAPTEVPSPTGLESAPVTSEENPYR
jgi:hypothetical protein